MMRIAVFVCFVTSAWAAAIDGDVGHPLRLCPLDTEDMNFCLKDRLQELLPRLAREGANSLVAPLDPLSVSHLGVQYKGGEQAVAMAVRDSVVRGLGAVRVTAVRAALSDPADLRVQVDFLIPRLEAEGKYKMDGHVLVDIHSGGHYNLSMSTVSGTFDFRGRLSRKPGVDRLWITSFHMFPEVGDMTVYASNLIPGNEELNAAALRLINTYWSGIYRSLLRDADAAWDRYVTSEMNKLFANVAFRDLFPGAP